MSVYVKMGDRKLDPEQLERALRKIRAADPQHSHETGQFDRWWKNVTDLIDAALAGREIAP